TMDNGENLGCRDCKPHKCKWQIKPEEWFSQEYYNTSCRCAPKETQFHCLACHINVTPSNSHVIDALIKNHVDSSTHFDKVSALHELPAQLQQELVPQLSEKDIMAINQGMYHSRGFYQILIYAYS